MKTLLAILISGLALAADSSQREEKHLTAEQMLAVRESQLKAQTAFSNMLVAQAQFESARKEAESIISEMSKKASCIVDQLTADCKLGIIKAKEK